MNPGDTAPPPGESRADGWVWRLAWIAVYSAGFLIALRFGGRTYPGWYFPNSSFLNSLLNGPGLFTEIGYDLVLVIAVSATMRVLGGRRKSPALRPVQWTATLFVILIILYGVAWAILMHRLPWQEDGLGRYTPFLSIDGAGG